MVQNVSALLACVVIGEAKCIDKMMQKENAGVKEENMKGTIAPWKEQKVWTHNSTGSSKPS